MTRTLLTLIIAICALSLCPAAHSDDVVLRIVGPQSEEDTSQIYFEQLFIMAMQHSEGPGSNISIEKIPFSENIHGGEIRLLNTDVIDLFWSATDKKIESQLLPVRIPLVMGLLGYRVAITHKRNLDKFHSLKDLKHYKACRVRHWTDVEILEFNQFTVVPTDSYERTFELTHKGRCDYFPRAIYEGYFELSAAQKRYPQLTMFDDILLYYPFPLYVFTSNDNLALNHKLHKGLSYLVTSGKLLEHIKSSEISQHVFPLSKWQNKPIKRLENPFLPQKTPLEDPSLWLDLNSDSQ